MVEEGSRKHLEGLPKVRVTWSLCNYAEQMHHSSIFIVKYWVFIVLCIVGLKISPRHVKQQEHSCADHSNYFSIVMLLPSLELV